MNKVLIICGDFLPIRNGGTIRCEKLVKYLPKYNWKTIVLTKKPSKEQKIDNSITVSYCKIYRTNRYDLAKAIVDFNYKLKSFFLKKNESKKIIAINQNNLKINKRRITEYFLLPDSDIFWAIGSFMKGLYIVIKENPNVILSTGPMHSSHIIGLFLKKTTRKKWIVEFRDPWTMNPFLSSKPFDFLDKIDNILEKIVLKNADRINVTSLEYKNQFLNKYKFIEEYKIVNIPNGFDPDDFNNHKLEKNDKFTIVHSGNFYSERSSVVFIKAIIDLFNNNLLDCNNITVKFIGLLDDIGKQLIINSGFSDAFEIYGNVSHSKSINEICNADLLLLIPGPGSGTIPGKFYEYLASKKPIFCMVNEGPVKEMILENNLGSISNDNDIDEVKKKILILINDILTKKDSVKDINRLLEKYSRINIARQMSEIFSS